MSVTFLKRKSYRSLGSMPPSRLCRSKGCTPNVASPLDLAFAALSGPSIATPCLMPCTPATRLLGVCCFRAISYYVRLHTQAPLSGTALPLALPTLLSLLREVFPEPLHPLWARDLRAGQAAFAGDPWDHLPSCVELHSVHLSLHPAPGHCFHEGWTAESSKEQILFVFLNPSQEVNVF